MAMLNKKIIKLKCGTEIILRSPTVDDSQKYIDYCKSLFKTSKYVIIQSDEYKTNIDEQKKWIEGFEEKTCSICIVAELESKIIGGINLKGRENRRRVKHRAEFGLGILESWRGKGLGKILLQEVISWAKSSDNSLEKIELIVTSENKPAMNLYTGLGFKEEGRILKEIKISENQYIDGIFMGLWLNE